MSSDPTLPPVVIHTSWRGLGGAIVTPTVLLALGIAALAVAGARPIPLALTVAGAGLGAVVALDFPRHTVFDDAGVTRVCMARRHHLPWSRLVAIHRARPTTTARVRQLTDRRNEQYVSGGLVARGAGRRRWLLTDRVESQPEYDRLEALMGALDAVTRLRAARPHDGVPPTDLYRPRRSRRGEPGASDG